MPEASEDIPQEVIEAKVIRGSDFPAVYRRGTTVRIERDQKTGQVIVTRGAGALRIAIVADAASATIRERIERGVRITGQIVEVDSALDATTIRIQLDLPR